MGGPLGFDLEWESEGGVPRRVALVQLSTVHVVVLIQVSAMRGKLANDRDALKTADAYQCFLRNCWFVVVYRVL